jgi:hypothetical protein
MSSFPLNDAGAFVSSHDGNASENSGAPSLITAAGALDNVEVEGQTVDRKSGSAIAHSAIIATGWLAALTDTKTLSLAHAYQDSADDSTWNTAVAIEAATVKQTAAASTNYRGVDEHDLNLRTLDRYIRINVTLDLNAGATDTALFFTVVTLAGWTQVPQG